MSERQLLFLLSAEQAKAFARLVEAAGRGDGDAACRLGDLYREGVGGTRHSPRQAFHWYARSAMAGDANGRNNLGACYEHGLGCTQSYARAVKWYRRSSAQGLGTASMNLGYCHLRGHGVPADRGEAPRLFRLAVERGEERARVEVEQLAPAVPSVPEPATEARAKPAVRFVPRTESGKHIGVLGIGGVAPPPTQSTTGKGGNMLTQRYRAALQFAATVHDGQLRKGTEVPYLSHLLSVSALVIESGGTEDEAIAALLHDAVEDRGDDYQGDSAGEPRNGREALKRDIERQFGAAVLAIVCQCTDDEYLPDGLPSQKGTPEEWLERKAHYVAALHEKTDVAALRVSCADKLHNARAILADYEVEGDAVWQRFRVKSKDAQLKYYRDLAGVFTERGQLLGDPGLQRMARRLTATVAAIARHESG